jgi:hypothetical protein
MSGSDSGDSAFFAQMAQELEASVRKLEAREAELVAHLGAERVDELAALWAKKLDMVDEEELKRNMDWTDKELIWVWARLERARTRRVQVGRQVMINSRIVPDAGDGEQEGDGKKEAVDSTDMT